MDIANASMYEGASAFVEAVLMAERLTKKKTKVVVSQGVHPEYRRCLRTYLANFPFTIVEVPVGPDGATDAAALAAAVDDATFAVAVQSPNVFGVVESWDGRRGRRPREERARDRRRERDVLARRAPAARRTRASTSPAARPRPSASPPSFGGPLVGFLACRDAFKRQIPGRLVGKTRRTRTGAPAFCLTLSTREQHIRREKATSNICTNQGLFALAATMTLSALGKQGLRDTALQCLAKAEYLKAGVKALAGPFSLAFSGKTFNEFALRCGPGVDDGPPPRRGEEDPRGRPVRAARPARDGRTATSSSSP